MIETYKTVLKNSTSSYEDKKSKFLGYCFKIKSKEEVKLILKKIKEEHPKANHIPYAFKFGILNEEIGFSDDGEPTSSAGKPIYMEINGNKLKNILIVVVRYFGGVKLGVGGLVRAFSEAARLTIDESKIIEKEICHIYKLNFKYCELKEVEGFIRKNNLEILKKDFGDECYFEILVPINEINSFEEKFKIINIKFDKSSEVF